MDVCKNRMSTFENQVPVKTGEEDSLDLESIVGNIMFVQWYPLETYHDQQGASGDREETSPRIQSGVVGNRV